MLYGERTSAWIPAGTLPATNLGMNGLDRKTRMSRRLTAIVALEGDGYVALCPELDVARQGHTVGESRDDLCEAPPYCSKRPPARSSTGVCTAKFM